MIKMRVEFYLITDYDAANTDITHEVLKLTRGVSCIPGVTGIWTDDSGKTVLDDVIIMQTFMDDSPENRMRLESLALKYKEDAEQDCVMYVINTNEMYYI